MTIIVDAVAAYAAAPVVNRSRFAGGCAHGTSVPSIVICG
jgi:hypothetical protein